MSRDITLSGRRDLNPRPPRPERGALPSCATARVQRPEMLAARGAVRRPRPRARRPQAVAAASARVASTKRARRIGLMGLTSQASAVLRRARNSSASRSQHHDHRPPLQPAHVLLLAGRPMQAAMPPMLPTCRSSSTRAGSNQLDRFDGVGAPAAPGAGCGRRPGPPRTAPRPSRRRSPAARRARPRS